MSKSLPESPGPRSPSFAEIPGVTVFALAQAPCPNDFLVGADVTGGVRKTRDAAKKALQERIDAVLPQLEAQTNCAQYHCEEGDCEFDYLVQELPLTKYAGRTARRGKRKVRWQAKAVVLIGCFCPADGDDPEEGEEF